MISLTQKGGRDPRIFFSIEVLNINSLIFRIVISRAQKGGRDPRHFFCIQTRKATATGQY